MKAVYGLLLASAVLVFSSIGGAGGAGTVSGRALDTKGQPIVNAKIWVKPVVTTGLYETRTDSSGKYTATGLPPVGYRVMGWFERDYLGKRYCLRLGHPKATDYSPVNPAKGATRDLVWRIQGRIEDTEPYSDMGYFGGSVSIMNEQFVLARNAPLELTFTPTKPLIDGSSGKTLVRQPNSDGFILDVPVGVYKVTATRLENGQKKPVRLGNRADNLGSQAIIEFPASKQSCVGSTASGLERAYLYWGQSQTTSTNSSNGDGLIALSVPQTTSSDGLAGIWTGSLSVQGGETYLVKYEITDTEYGQGFVGLGGDFFECSSQTDCTQIGSLSAGKYVPGALVNFTTTFSQTGAAFETIGHLEGKTIFKGTTDAAFADGRKAALVLNKQ